MGAKKVKNHGKFSTGQEPEQMIFKWRWINHHKDEADSCDSASNNCLWKYSWKCFWKGEYKHAIWMYAKEKLQQSIQSCNWYAEFEGEQFTIERLEHDCLSL